MSEFYFPEKVEQDFGDGLTYFKVRKPFDYKYFTVGQERYEVVGYADAEPEILDEEWILVGAKLVPLTAKDYISQTFKPVQEVRGEKLTPHPISIPQNKWGEQALKSVKLYGPTRIRVIEEGKIGQGQPKHGDVEVYLTRISSIKSIVKWT